MAANLKLETPLWDHSCCPDEVYEPSEDTFLLLDALEEDLSLFHKMNPAIILELGSGSGIVITSIARVCKQAYCLAIDINPKACLATKSTAQLNEASVNVMQGDLISGLQLKNLVDILIFNPPYVPSGKGEVKALIDKAWAGDARGRSTTDRLFPQLKDLMSAKSVGYIVAIEENNPLEMCAILEKMGFRVVITKRRRIDGERISVIKFKKGI